MTAFLLDKECDSRVFASEWEEVGREKNGKLSKRHSEQMLLKKIKEIYEIYL
jgi:hypothetical protein